MSEESRKNISNGAKGRKVSAETRKKMSIARKGKTYRKGFKLSEEHKAKIGLAHRGLNLKNVGKRHFTNGLKNIFCRPEDCPEGFYPG